MNCKDCGIEHPSEHIANPHYCIARLQERLADAERVVDDVIRGRDLCNENGIKIGAIFLSRIMNAESYRQKYPEVK